nr:MAG TPA_asm: hypothetical protein [Caudoviricetes sp.]
MLFLDKKETGACWLRCCEWIWNYLWDLRNAMYLWTSAISDDVRSETQM